MSPQGGDVALDDLLELPRLYRDFLIEQGSERYALQVLSLLEDLLEHSRVSDWRALTRDQIEAFMAFCRDVGRQRWSHDGRKLGGPQKAGPKTRKSNIYAISGFYDWCIDGERGPFRRSDENPTTRVSRPKTIKRKQRAFTLEETRALLEHAPWERMVQYRTLAVAGPRHGAATEAPAAFYLLDHAPPRFEVPVEHSKTGREYVAALDPVTAKMLRIYRASREDYSSSLPLFSSRIRNDRLKRDCKAAGIALRDDRGRGVGFNCFRRFVPTALDKLGINASIAQAQLGHSNISTTLTHYTDTGLADQARAASALVAGIWGVDNRAQQANAEKPVDRATDSRYIASATFPMPNTTTISSERAAGSTGNVAVYGPDGPFARDSASPAPSGARRDVMGAAGLEPVARLHDIPPRAYDIASRVLRIVEDAMRSERAGLEEPAHDDRRVG